MLTSTWKGWEWEGKQPELAGTLGSRCRGREAAGAGECKMRGEAFPGNDESLGVDVGGGATVGTGGFGRLPPRAGEPGVGSWRKPLCGSKAL